ncbi:MAG: ion channel [Candidatus Micrarchaeaceae archaeon]
METPLKIAYATAIAAVFIFGIAGTYIIAGSGGFSMNNMTLLDAAYFTIVTMSTVGYGDITPVTALAKIFVIVLIVIGLSIFLSLVTLISGDFVNSRIERLSKRISGAERRGLSGHVVLIGTDGVNLAIAKSLHDKGKKFIVVTSDKVMLDRLDGLGYKAFVADLTTEGDMLQFRINRAESVIIDVRDSSLLVYSLLVIRTIAKGVKTIIIAPNVDSVRHLGELGILKNERLISPNNIAADAIMGSIM